jgi:3-oxoacyl-[acyl-carrier protein] reductase
MTSLSGKTALVTGASRGIGRATGLALAEAGAQVLIHYGQGKEEALAVVLEIRTAGGRAEALGADLSAPDGPHKLAKQVREVIGDRLDILVANAGISRAASIEETTIEDFDRLFAVNVRAPFFLVQQLLPILHEGSSVVLLSSLAARAAVGTLSAYAASKGAVDTLVKHFAAALGPRGIRVNAVAPGVVQTDMSNFTKTEPGRDHLGSMRPREITLRRTSRLHCGPGSPETRAGDALCEATLMVSLYRLTPIHLEFLCLKEHLRGTARGGLSCSHFRSSAACGGFEPPW